jgi:hypothetical protein
VRTRDRISTTTLFVGTALLVVAVGGIAALVMWLLHPSPKRPCIVNCPPPSPSGLTQSALPEGETFKSSTLGFAVNYPKSWKVQSHAAAEAVFETDTGLLKVQGYKGSPGFAGLVSKEVGNLDPTEFPDVKSAGTIKGAHIGSQQGEGQLYSATLYPPSGGGQGQLVRIALIGATRGDVTVLVTALVPYDQQSGRMAAEDVDYALTLFSWPGQ